MIRVTCASCSKTLAVKDENAGKKGKCPNCGSIIAVPSVGQTRNKKTTAAPDETEDGTAPDPFVSMASNAASSVASAAGSAAAAVGNAMTGIFKRSTDVIETTVEAPSWLTTFTRDNQSPEVVNKVVSKLNGILISEEQLSYIAVQNRPVVNFAPDCLALTNKRFIFYRPKLLGRVVFEDYVWRNLHDAKLIENVIGSTITIFTVTGEKLSLDYLPKEQARAVYRIAQEMEEKSLEDRRNRDLEEKRAAAGGVMVQTNVAVPTASQQVAAVACSDPMTKLQKLKSLYDAELITAAEYEKKKAEILDSM